MSVPSFDYTARKKARQWINHQSFTLQYGLCGLVLQDFHYLDVDLFHLPQCRDVQEEHPLALIRATEVYHCHTHSSNAMSNDKNVLKPLWIWNTIITD